MHQPNINGLNSNEIGNLPVNFEEKSSTNSIQSIFYRNTFNVFNLILFPLSALLFLVGQPGDAIFNCAFIAVNTGIAIFQEIRAKITLDKLKLIGAANTVVVRDGKEIQVATESVVLGDLVKVKIGDQIVADGEVVSCENASIDESLLTGESDYKRKETKDTVTSGTFVITGEIYYRTTAVGSDRFSSLILKKSKTLITNKSTLEKKMDRILYTFLQIMIFLVTLQIISQLLKLAGGSEKFSFNSLVLQVSTIVSALVPVGLVLVTSISYAAAARRMLASKVLVNKIAAIETMCHLDTLCIDKTGTITTNQIVVDAVIPFNGVEQNELLLRLKSYSLGISQPNKTVLAIVDYFSTQKDISNIKTLKERPFESKSKYSGVLFDDEVVYYMGAPEILLKYCEEDLSEVEKKLDELFNNAKRCLVLLEAKKFTQTQKTSLDLTVDKKYTVVGIVVLSDTIRDEAFETIKSLQDRGITLKIISGDNQESVAVIAKSIGFNTVKEISGLEMADMTPEDFEIAVLTSNVFGRITPNQKERIIYVLQKNGHFTGMIGDGVNDVLAIKKANLGIAMNSGSQMAKDISDLVLIDNSFGSLPVIISQGEQIYSNIIKVSKLFVAKSVFFTLIFILFGYLALQFPLLPRQFTLVNTIIIGVPAIFIALLPLKKEISVNFNYTVFRFSIISGLIFSFTGLFTYITSNIVNNDVLKFGTMEDLINISRTALVITLVFGGLMNIAMVTMSNESTNEARKINTKILIVLGSVLALFLVGIQISSIKTFFEVTSMSLMTYFVIIFYSGIGGWIFYKFRKIGI